MKVNSRCLGAVDTFLAVRDPGDLAESLNLLLSLRWVVTEIAWRGLTVTEKQNVKESASETRDE